MPRGVVTLRAWGIFKGDTMRCEHIWEVDDAIGCRENPGTTDNGSGGIEYWQRCGCGARRRRGSDYTGHRPGNTYPWRIWQHAVKSGGAA